MKDKKNHLRVNTVILTILGVLLYFYILDSTLIIVMIYLAIPIGALFPDLDQVFKKANHRDWRFHSIIWIVICWFLCIQYPIFLLFVSILMVSIGIHLLFDINIRKSKQVGFYCINIRGKRLSGTTTTVWLILNYIIAFIFLLLTIWVWFYV